MNKKVKNTLIFIIVLAVLTCVVLLLKLNARLPENPVTHAGNTAGNLYNRGLFVEDDEYIYFANPADSFRLYRMNHDLENVERIHQDSVEYLNMDATSTFLYYSRINYRHNTNSGAAFDILGTGIYRFQTEKKSLTRLYPSACGAVLLGGNSLYFQTHGEDGNYDLESLVINEEKGKRTLLTTDYLQPACYQNGLLYYSELWDDHCLYTLSPETGVTTRFADLDCFQPIVTENGTYFLSMKHNYSLFHLPNTSDTATLISDSRISSYNLSKDGRFLFYQVDDRDNSRLCRYDLSTQTETELLAGDYKNLNTVSGYLFFTDFAETSCYCYDISSGSLLGFAPLAD